MNCPYCGSTTLDEHEFCRACGNALSADERGRRRPQVWALAFLALMFGGIMVALAGKGFDIKWLLYTGVVLSLLGIFLMAAFSMLLSSRPRKRKIRKNPQPEQQQRADTTNKLLPIPAADDFIPSVTDATTGLLKTPNSKARTK